MTKKLQFMLSATNELNTVLTRFLILIGGFLIFLALTSCGTYDKLVYFQDGENTDNFYKSQSYTPVFQPDDLISILVMSENPEDAEPFNLPVSFTSLSKSNNGYYNGIPSSGGYLIDSIGNVSLPILGVIKLGD